MTKFHAVMIDETGCEFGASIEAKSKSIAYELLRQDYPESRCVQLESPKDRNAREDRLQRQIEREYDDPHGYHYGED